MSAATSYAYQNGQHVQTRVWIWGERSVVNGRIVARRHGWFGRERYLVRYSVRFGWDSPGDMGTSTYVKWRGPSRLWSS